MDSPVKRYSANWESTSTSNIRLNFRGRKAEVEYHIVNSHGSVIGEPLFRILEDVREFSVKNPKEFIIMRFQQEKGFLPGFCKLLLTEYLVKLFGSAAINQEDRRKFFRVKDVTMGDLWTHGKKFLILVKNEFFDDYLVDIDGNLVADPSIAEQELKEKGIFDKEKFLLDNWFNRDSATKLLQDMDESFHKVNRRGFRVSHYVFSPQKKFKLGYLFKPPTIKSLEKNEFLEDHRVMSHIIEAVNNGRDINIGRHKTNSK